MSSRYRRADVAFELLVEQEHVSDTHKPLLQNIPTNHYYKIWYISEGKKETSSCRHLYNVDEYIFVLTYSLIDNLVLQFTAFLGLVVVCLPFLQPTTWKRRECMHTLIYWTLLYSCSLWTDKQKGLRTHKQNYLFSK